MLDWLEGPAVAATLRRVKELGAPVVGLRMRNADCSGEQLSRIILAQAEFEDVKFDGANLDNAVFTDAKMNRVSFSGASLNQTKFFKTQFRDCSARKVQGFRLAVLQSELDGFDAQDGQFTEARFVESTFRGVNLSRSNLDTAVLVDTTHDQTDFSNAMLEQTCLYALDLRTCQFKGVRGRRIVLASSRLDGVDLKNVYMPQAQCSETSFEQTEFAGADLSGANFVDTNFTNAKLQKAQLTLAAFVRANLSGANLEGAVLDKARLVKCDVTGALLKDIHAKRSVWHLSNLTNSDFTAAVLDGSDMIGANLQGADFRQASMVGVKLDLTKQEELKIDKDSLAVSSPKDPGYAAFVMQSTL